jgi:NCS2 family nucleobase:cation symporter-2
MSAVEEKAAAVPGECDRPARSRGLVGWLSAWSRSADRPVRRVPTVAYALDETPPPATVASLAAQYLFVLMSLLLLPPLVAAAGGKTPAEAVDFVRLSMIGTGVATLLQCLSRGPVGSGYAVPATATPVFFGASILAIQAGGLPLVAGMTVFAGLVVILVASVAHRLRALFPAEVTGVIVLMIAFDLAPNGLRQMLTVTPEMPDVPRWAVLAVAGASFATMAGVAIQRGTIQRHGVLIGVLVGIPLALLLGVVRPDAGTILGAQPLLAPPPRPVTRGFDFDWALAIPFAVAALVSSAKAIADLAIVQKAGDAGWVRADLGPLRRGLLASGLGSIVSGGLGGTGVGTSTACVGMTLATGVMSRAPVVLVGLVLVGFGCMPRAAALIEVIPPPVAGAMILFVACFMTVSAVQLLTSRMLDARRTLVVGVSLALGLGAEFDEAIFHGLLPRSLASGATLAALSALGLNLLFMIGSKRSGRLSIALGEGIAQQVSAGLDRLGGAWGARREVILQVSLALIELAELLARRDRGACLEVDLSFDEYTIRATAGFAGPALVLPERRPTEGEVLADYTTLAGYLIPNLADRVTQQSADGRTRITLGFQH